MATVRSQRMINSSNDYYQESPVFAIIQEAHAKEYDTVDAHNEDLINQMYIMTATWGLKYWEAILKIPVNTADSYDIRRSRVLSKWRGIGNFSVELIKSIAAAYSNGEVATALDIPGLTLTITFTGTKGVPPNLSDMEAIIDDIIHAHIAVVYAFTYTLWSEIKAGTWNDAKTGTWDQLKVR